MHRQTAAVVAVGTAGTRLVVLRGPSGSGKSSAARALRAQLGRGLALVEQDYLRRLVLKERDVPGGANIELISDTTRFALNRGWDVVLDGIMHAEHYSTMLNQLRIDHAGHTAFYYFDVSWEETLRRHHTRPQAQEFDAEEMREWYQPRDLLGLAEETIVPETRRSTRPWNESSARSS